MINSQDLLNLAKSRFDEAQILLLNKKPDGAVYLCGYSIELMLKRHIVKILNWEGYPDTNNEFENYKSFKVHNLDVLLNLAGLEKKVQLNTKMFTLWQIAKNWNSEFRYKQVGLLSISDAKSIIEASRSFLNYLSNI
jgi:hypothetical protein